MSTGHNRISFDMADAIRTDWGKFIEITNGNLMMLFGTGRMGPYAEATEVGHPWCAPSCDEAKHRMKAFFSTGDEEVRVYGSKRWKIFLGSRPPWSTFRLPSIDAGP